MKTDTGITHYSSRSDYMKNRTSSKAMDLIESSDADSLKKVQDKVELSSEGKKKAQESAKGLKEEVKKNLDQNKTELKKAGSHLLGDAVSVAKNAFNTPGLGTLAEVASNLIPDSTPVKEVAEVVLPKEEKGESEGPKVIFVSGLHLAGLSDGGEGLEAMAVGIENGEHYSWKDEEKIIDEIRRTPKEEPVVLVGHSLGGDAVVNISNRLNSLEHGFRKVDLLVTLDSVGFDNDIIPKNVKKNLNFIGDEDVFFNDGPNIARNFNKTTVVNELRKESHTELDDSHEIQEQVFNEINSVLTSYKERNNEAVVMKDFLANLMKQSFSNEDTSK
jgi:hypothetical protein